MVRSRLLALRTCVLIGSPNSFSKFVMAHWLGTVLLITCPHHVIWLPWAPAPCHGFRKGNQGLSTAPVRWRTQSHGSCRSSGGHNSLSPLRMTNLELCAQSRAPRTSWQGTLGECSGHGQALPCPADTTRATLIRLAGPADTSPGGTCSLAPNTWFFAQTPGHGVRQQLCPALPEAPAALSAFIIKAA